MTGGSVVVVVSAERMVTLPRYKGAATMDAYMNPSLGWLARGLLKFPK